MKQTAAIFLALFFLALSAVSCDDSTVRPTTDQCDLDEIADRWNAIVGQRDEFLRKRRDEADRFHAAYDSTDRELLAERAAMAMRLGHLYRAVNIDSALKFYRRSCNDYYASGDYENATAARIRRATLLPLRNRINEAYDEAKRVDLSSIQDSATKVAALMSALILYERINAYSNREELQAESDLGIMETLDSLEVVLRSESVLQNYVIGKRFSRMGKHRIAEASFRAAAEQCQPENDIYPIIWGAIAESLHQRGLDNEALAAAMTGAEAGFHSKIQFTEQTIVLATYIRQMGDVGLAYRMISVALNESIISGADMTALAASKTYAGIVDSYIDRGEAKVRWLAWGIAVLAVVVVVGGGWFLWRGRAQRRREAVEPEPSAVIGQEPVAEPQPVVAPESAEPERVESELVESESVEPEPIAEERMENTSRDRAVMTDFIGLVSHALDNTEALKKIAKRKIATGQVNDLYDYLKSDRPLANQGEKFAEVFDPAFAGLYPTFAEDINARLLPDGQLRLSADGRLSTEARIFALMRLGVDDAAKIAAILGVSVNTIYTYRNRVRSKALSRVEFDNWIASGVDQ